MIQARAWFAPPPRFARESPVDLPPAAFGLHDRVASQPTHASSPRVSTTSAPPEDDPVPRRTFLVATGIVGRRRH